MRGKAYLEQGSRMLFHMPLEKYMWFIKAIFGNSICKNHFPGGRRTKMIYTLSTIYRFIKSYSTPLLLAGFNRLFKKKTGLRYRKVKDSEGDFSQTVWLHTRISSPLRRALVHPAVPILFHICSSIPRPPWCHRSLQTHWLDTANPSGLWFNFV